MALSTPSLPPHAAPRVAHIGPDDMDVDVDVDDDAESDADEEVDQLDSDTTEDEKPPAPGATGSAKARQRRPVQRVAGQPAIPLDRVETILDGDGIGSYMSKEALFMLAAATEAFVKRLAEASHRRAASERRSMMSYRDLAATAAQRKEFRFLQDTIPQPLSIAEALERRAAKEKELLEPPTVPLSARPSPLPSFTPLPTPLPSAAPSISSSRAPKGKGRPVNGTPDSASATPAPASAAPHPPKTTSASAGSRRQSAREPKPRRRADEPPRDTDSPAEQHPHPHPHPPAQNGGRARAPRTAKARHSDGPAAARGRGHAVNGVGANGHAPPGPPVAYLAPEYASVPNGVAEAGSEELWPPALPSPPHGAHPFVGGPGVPFVRNGLTENPGRTIYSQHRQPNR